MKRYLAGTAKALGDNRFGGYALHFTDASKPDLHGEYFDASTELLLPSFPVKGAMAFYQHGLDDDISVMRLGDIDHAELRDDGLYVEGVLRFADYARETIKSLKQPDDWKKQQIALAKDYEEEIKDLLEKGVLKFSSGALPQSVVVDKTTGHIKQWGIVEVSLTPTPAEPRNLTQANLLRASLAEQSKEPTAIEATRNADSGHLDSTITEGNRAMTKETSLTALKMDEGELRKLIAEELDKMAQQVAESDKAEGDEDEDDETKAEGDEDDENKAEGDEDDEDEDMMDDKTATLIRTILKEQAKLEQAKTAKVKAKAKDTASLKQMIDDSIKNHLATMNPPTYSREQAGAKTNRTTPHIGVAEPRLYQGLSAMEMALGIKLAEAKIAPEVREIRRHIGLNTFSEEYYKSMIHKMANDMKQLPDVNPRDTMAVIDRNDMKAAFPFKADELNASNLTTQGDEWVTVWYDTNLWDRVREETQLMSLLTARGMRTVDVPQGAESVDVFLATGSGTVYTGREANSVDATGRPEVVVDINPFTTDKVNMPLAKHTLAYSITYELEERSIIGVVSHVNADMLQTLAEAQENAIVNGDTTIASTGNINRDNSTPPTTQHGQTPLYTAWDGIRHAYLVDHTARGDDHASAALAVQDFEAVLGLFDNPFRLRRASMLFVVDGATESAMRVLPEVLTYDTGGPRHTMYTGIIPPMMNVQVYASGFMPRTGTDGRVDADGSGVGANVLGGIAAVYAPYWQYSRQRAIMIEADRFILSQSTAMVASVTHSFRRRGDNAAAGKYAITVA